MRTVTLIAPAHWASYLINGDASGLDRAERWAVDAWLASEGLGLPVSCEPAGFTAHHDATRFAPCAADCEAFDFLAAP